MFVHLPSGIVSGARFHVRPRAFTHARVPVNMCVRTFWYFMHVHVCVSQLGVPAGERWPASDPLPHLSFLC